MPDGEHCDDHTSRTAPPAQGSAGQSPASAPRARRTPVEVLLTHGLATELVGRLGAAFADAESAAASLYRHHDGECATGAHDCPWCDDGHLARVDVAAVLAAVDAWSAVGWLEHGLLSGTPRPAQETTVPPDSPP